VRAKLKIGLTAKISHLTATATYILETGFSVLAYTAKALDGLQL